VTYMIVSERTARQPVRVRVPEDAYHALKKYWRKKKEHFLVCTLNGAHEIVAIRIVSIGTVNRSLVHPREVFTEAIKDAAVAVIVAHNHPSGNVVPSVEDRQVTQSLKDAGEILGIKLLDHLVFSHKGFYSFLDHGEL